VQRLGVPLERLHDSCNRLPAHDGRYDAVTVSQALHWLDDVAVCRGVCRVLRPGGSFVVVHAALTLPPEHPLSFVLGDRTPLGDKATAPFSQQADALARRLGLLFEALDTPDVQRIDPSPTAAGAHAPIAFAATTLLQDERPIDLGFARAFLSPRHVAATGMTPDAFWARAAAACDAAGPAGLIGRQDWAVLHFRRGGRAAATAALAA
jgi:SAM-dependent methyltransferase